MTELLQIVKWKENMWKEAVVADCNIPAIYPERLRKTTKTSARLASLRAIFVPGNPIIRITSASSFTAIIGVGLDSKKVRKIILRALVESGNLKDR
jgi:hypothetical protein